ncbi:MAG: hypothetical protein LC746_02455, partial [Acidobacteria bacterium]|nr:hypothetical protein [Acidobacteriota bacterium]
MNGLLAVLALLLGAAVVSVAPAEGAAALVVCAAFASVAGLFVRRIEGDGAFLTRLFVVALLLRVVVGFVIYIFHLQPFFGGDALTYDSAGSMLSQAWLNGWDHSLATNLLRLFLRRNWGMSYLVGVLYTVVGRNMLAVQFFNAVVGAATAP